MTPTEPKRKTIGEMSRQGTWKRSKPDLPTTIEESDTQFFADVKTLAAADARFAPFVELAQKDPSVAMRVVGAVSGSAVEARRMVRDYPDHAWIVEESKKSLERHASRWAQSSIYQLAAAHDLLRSEVADAAFDASKTPDEERTDSARDELAAAVASWVRERIDALGFGNEYTIGPSEEDGMLRQDARFAAELERFEGMQPHAKKIRAAATKRAKGYDDGEPSGSLYVLWVDPTAAGGAKYLPILALAIWQNVVWPRRKLEFAKRPALAFYVHEEVTRIHSRAFQLETKDGQRALTFDDEDPIILAPSIEDDSLTEIVERGAKLLGGLHAHQALRWEIVTGHTQAINGAPDPRVINVEGGWSVLAHDILGIKKKSAAEDIRAIVHAQQAVRIPLPTGGMAHGLLSFTDSPAVGRRRGHIEITLGSMLLPHFVHEIQGRGRIASEARRLVPVPREAPPMVGRSNDHGPLSTLSMLVMRELRANARGLATDGSVRITDERFALLATKARVPLSTLKLALDRWTRDGDDGPAFLASPTRWAYTLGKAYTPELAFLVAAGKKELAASEAGRKSVAAKERALLGKGRPRR